MKRLEKKNLGRIVNYISNYEIIGDAEIYILHFCIDYLLSIRDHMKILVLRKNIKTSHPEIVQASKSHVGFRFSICNCPEIINTHFTNYIYGIIFFDRIELYFYETDENQCRRGYYLVRYFNYPNKIFLKDVYKDIEI